MSATNIKNQVHECLILEYRDLKDIMREGKTFVDNVTVSIEYLLNGTTYGFTQVKKSSWYEITIINNWGMKKTYLDKIRECPYCDEKLRRSRKSTKHEL